jgi:uridine kinase
MTLLPETTVFPKRLTVIEGVYSMHPYFSKYYDLAVFLDVDPNIQRERIKKRNSEQLAERFFGEWIPFENKYFKEMSIKEFCQIIIPMKQK